MIDQISIIIDMSSKERGNLNTVRKKQARNALTFIIYFQVIWARLNSLNRWEKAENAASTNLGRIENGQEKCQRFLLKRRLKIQRELCGVGIWGNSGTSS